MPPTDYWITSSAVASKVSGTSMSLAAIAVAYPGRGCRGTAYVEVRDFGDRTQGHLLRCMSPFVALRWHNLPCALTAAIGYGKQTLGDPDQSDPPRGPW
jgi:hypothetical protein